MVIDLNQPLPYLATAAFVALMGFYAWSQPHRPENRYFFWIVGVWLVWAMAAGFATVVQTTELRYGMWLLQVFCVLTGSPFELMFFLEFTGNEKWIYRRILAFLAFPVILFGLLVISAPRHYLVSIEMRSGFEVFMMSALMKWSFFASNLVIWLIGVGLLFGNMLRAPAFSLPIGLIIFGHAIPRIAFVAVSLAQSSVSPIQITVLFTNITALVYILGLYNFRLLRVVPVARDKAIYYMPYAMLVLDAENYLVDFNPAAQALPGMPVDLTLRQAPDRALGEWWERISPLVGPEQVSQDVTVQTSAGQRYFHVLGLPLLQASGWRIGEVFVLEDITQAQQAQQMQAQTVWAQASLQEREQLADELHDSISQSLAFLNLQAQTIQVYLQAGQSQVAQASLNRLAEAACQVQEETRELISNLLDASLPAGNFCTTMGQILIGFERQTGLTVHLEMDGDSGADWGDCFNPSSLPPPIAVQLVRITQEALANVRKHAWGASQVSVRLKAGDGQVFLTISDDGEGFDVAGERSDGKHFGLRIMQRRAANIGGQVDIHSAPGKGTFVEARVPLPVDKARSRE